MPNSVFSSGGGRTSALAVRDGINQSADIDLLLAAVDDINSKLDNLTVTPELRAPTLRPVVVGAANEEASSGTISPPGEGKILLLQIAGWYNIAPTGGFLTITGTDNNLYLKVPVTASGAGYTAKVELPMGIGCVVKLSAGGPNCIGYLNVGYSVREA